MIRAHKGGLATWALEAYLKRKMRGAFRGLWLRGELPSNAGGLLAYANHTSWWDGFVVHALSQAARWDAYCLMEEKNLERYRFLTRIGAFSVQPGQVGSSLASLRYAKGLLQKKEATVFLFPEGEIRPFGQLPLRLAGGVEVLARAADAACFSVGIRYAFFEHEKPDILLEVGRTHPPVSLAEFGAHLQERVASLEAVKQLDGFRQLLSGRAGVAERWDRVRGFRRGGAG